MFRKTAGIMTTLHESITWPHTEFSATESLSTSKILKAMEKDTEGLHQKGWVTVPKNMGIFLQYLAHCTGRQVGKRKKPEETLI